MKEHRLLRLSGSWAVLVVAIVLARAVSSLSDVSLDVGPGGRDRVLLRDGSTVECTVLVRGKRSVTVLVDGEEKTFAASLVQGVEEALPFAGERLFLSDGRIVKGTVIMRGKDSVTVLVGNRERTFLSSDVLRIEKGLSAGERKRLKTGPVAGHLQITAGDSPAPPAAVSRPAPPSGDKAAQRKAARRAARRERELEGKAGAENAGERRKEKGRRPRAGEDGPLQGVVPQPGAEKKKGPRTRPDVPRKLQEIIDEVVPEEKQRIKVNELIDMITELRKKFREINPGEKDAE